MFNLQKLPEEDNPELFGLHPNAAITSQKYQVSMFLESLLKINPNATKTQKFDKYSIVINQIKEILPKQPDQFNIEQVLKNFPTSYDNSMNTVLIQELLRYNVLIETISTTLQDLNSALQGTIIMNPELEELSEQLSLNKIPQLWLKRSYPSVKSLASYYKDYGMRIEMLKQWIFEGQPIKFWIPGFFFIQSFFTGILQNYARKHKISIDQLDFDYKISLNQEIEKKPKDGCYAYGLYLEGYYKFFFNLYFAIGARWDITLDILQEQQLQIIYDQLPIFLIIPTEKKNIYFEPHEFYQCPLYKTSERKGILSTTGHSTNFVVTIKLPSKVHEDHWIKRGVALLTQLDD